ncbi:MAG TPA: pyrroloquinoline quinone biosynthesis protein PqqE [Candidatus Acidoferrum sp.]|nr:pyrroloquinoline quinone biosynthesis protein PqqE [Candidatus Acidoferrum sp.]
MTTISNPLALIAELTHRCPLHCVYCSNPLELQSRANELPTDIWSRVFREAARAGVLQADFTGGEPLARTDIVDLIRAARSAGLYVSLITSGLPLDEPKLEALVQAGLDHLQLSFQGAREDTVNEISGTKSHAHKLRVLEWLKRHHVAVTLNFVIHRRNIDQLEEMLAIAESSSATRVEFANVQYYGWAFANRENLLPTRQQLDHSVEFVKRAEERLQGKIRIEFVVPDYYAKFPKPCVGGWGRKLMLITPSGDALPCHAAKVIPGLPFENVKNHSLREIWDYSVAFQKFRGEDWMQEPCKTCDRRELDLGGCRCQALLLTGDAAATDPVCSLAPQRPKVDAILANLNLIPAPIGIGPAPGSIAAGLSSAPAADPITKPFWLYRPNPA